MSEFARDPMTGLWRPRQRFCSMLPGLGRPPLGAGGAAPFVTNIVVEDMGTTNDTGTDDVGTFSGFSFGDEAANRYLIAGISAMDGASVFALNSVTIGGTAAFVTEDDAGQTLAGLASANIPTGASGDVLATFSEALTFDQQCALLRVTGISSSTSSAKTVVTSGTSCTINWDSVATTGGQLIVVVCAKRNSAVAGTISDTGISTNPWNEVENLVPPDGGARLGMWWKIFEKNESGNDFDVTVTGGASLTEYAMILRQFNPE